MTAIPLDLTVENTQEHIPWENHVPTERSRRWVGSRNIPPTSVAPDTWTRWRLVREAIRTNEGLGLGVDHVRRIQRRVRPDAAMTSDHGEVDALTVISVMWFQVDHGLPPTGLLETSTTQQLIRVWPELKGVPRCRLGGPGLIVPDDADELARFLLYRDAILDAGGVFDDRHRAVNLLVVRDARLLQGRSGLAVRDQGTRRGRAPRDFVTVSLWLEREDGDDDGEVLRTCVAERPGFVRPVRIEPLAVHERFEGGQYVCDLGREGPHVDRARAWLPRHTDEAGAVPIFPPTLPLVEGLCRSQIEAPVDPQDLRYGRLICELVAMREIRLFRDEWKGFRVLLVDAARVDSPWR